MKAGLRRAAALIALVAVASFGAASAQPLRLAVSRGPVSLPIYVAEARGWFRAEGLQVELLDCSSGRQCFERLEDGQADVATAAELIAVLNSARRSDLALIATLSTSSHQIKLVARRSSGMHEPGQLAGKRIATVGGTSAEFFLDRWLSFNVVDPQDMRLTTLAPDRLVAALVERQVDAIAIWEPLATMAMTELGADALLLPSARVYTQHFSLTTTRAVIRRRGEDLQRLLRALLRAQRSIAEEPEQAKAVLRSRLTLGPATADALLAHHDFRIRLDQSLPSTMDSQLRWAVRLGLVDAASKPPNLLRIVEADPLRRIAPAAVGLVP